MSAGRAWELTPEQWKDVIDVNLTGTFYTLKAAVPAMIEAGNGGSIIIISSAAGRKERRSSPTTPRPSTVWSASPARSRSNSASTTSASTPCIRWAWPPLMVSGPTLPALLPSVALTIGPTYMNTLPYDFLEPEAVTNMVAWLAGDESRYCTGAQFVVDLGNTSR